MSARDDALEACLEDLERGGLTVCECLRRRDIDAGALAPLLRTAERYRHAPAVRPSSAFRLAARARLLNLIAATASAPKPAPSAQRRVSPWGRLRLAGGVLRIAAAVALLLGVAGSTVAAAAAPPESPLYPARLALEEARLMLARGDVERAELRLDIAERRAWELERLAGRATPGELEQAALRYEAATQAALVEVAGAGVAPAALLRVESRLAYQEQILQEAMALLGGAGPEERASLGQALGLLERERAELRDRVRNGSFAPSETPIAWAERERRRRQGPAATFTPTPPPSETPEPTATPIRYQREEMTQDQERVRYRLGQAPDPVASLVGATATLASGGQEPTRTPTARSGPPSATPTCCDRTPTCTPEARWGATATPQQVQSRQQGQPTPTPSPTPQLGETATPTSGGPSSGEPPPAPTPALRTAPVPTLAPTAEPVPTPGSSPGPGGPGGPGPTSPGGGRR